MNSLRNMSLRQESYSDFARELYNVAIGECGSADGTGQLGRNAIISPISIQTSLLMVFVGAGGRTAEQMRAALKLGPGDLQQIARSYHEVSQLAKSYGSKITLKFVNRLFVNEFLRVCSDFKDICQDYFNYLPEPINFTNAKCAVQCINELVEKATEQKIQNLLQPDAVDEDTSAVLVNALYFKGLFARPFSVESTVTDKFFIGPSESVEMPMMQQEDKFKYVELPEMGARAVALPFADSDIQLLIVLPNDNCGLPALEDHLSKADLADITSRMETEDVEIALPKFSIQFDMDLKQSLAQLGITHLFGHRANLSHLFRNAHGQRISDARHRGYIDVNEAGCEAVAVTFLKIVPMSLNMCRKTFRVDHPFVFFIRNSKCVFFAGRFVSPPMPENDEKSSS